MKIAVCDDQEVEIKKLNQVIMEYQSDRALIDVDVHSFSSSIQLLKQLDSGERFDIYLLDIIMPGIDGIHLGKSIREVDQNCILVYLTSSRDFALDAYGVFAFQYLIKPVDKEMLFRILDSSAAQLDAYYAKSVPVKTKEGIVNIFYHMVIYVEYRSHVLYFHLTSGMVVSSIHIRTTFEEAVTALIEDDRFIYSHKSYLVNMNQVRKIAGSTFVMLDDSVIPITKKNYGNVKSHYMKFLSKKGSGLSI